MPVQRRKSEKPPISLFQQLENVKLAAQKRQEALHERARIMPEILEIIAKNRAVLESEAKQIRKLKPRSQEKIKFYKQYETPKFIPTQQQVDDLVNHPKIGPVLFPERHRKPLPQKAAQKDEHATTKADPFYKSLVKKYAPFVGQIIHNPDVERDHLPPIITRAVAAQGFDALLPSSHVEMCITQVIEMDGEMWLKALTKQMAEVMLRLGSVHPFFMMDAPILDGFIPPKTEIQKKAMSEIYRVPCEAIEALLNEVPHRPRGWDKSFPSASSKTPKEVKNKRFKRNHDEKKFDEIENSIVPEDAGDDSTNDIPMPVVSVTIEYRTSGVIFTGRDLKPYFRLNFQNFAAFRHYRELFALGHFNASLGFPAKIHHEENSLSQQLFNLKPFQLFGWIWIEKQHCNFLDPSEWSEVYDPFREADDAQLAAEAEWRKTHPEFNEEEEQQERHKRPWNGQRLPEHLRDLQIPKCRTKAIFESTSCSIDHIHTNPNDTTPPKLLQILFDIETLRGKSMEAQCRRGKTPSLFEPDHKESDFLPDPCQGMISQIREEKLEKEDEEKHRESGRYKRIHPKDDLFDVDDEDEAGLEDGQTVEEIGMVFPAAKNVEDSVGVISSHLMVYGHTKSFLRVLHCLGRPRFLKEDVNDRMVVFTFDDEKTMLEHWTGMVSKMNTETLAGYNSIGYDLPYIHQRAQVLKSSKVLENLSRFLCTPQDRILNPRRHLQCIAKAQYMNRRNFKSRDMPLVETPGLAQFDAYKVVKQLNPNLDEYKLANVAKKYQLPVSKKDMPYELISPFWASSSKHQREVAMYCDMDVEVTEQVMSRGSFVSHAIAVSQLSYSSIVQQMMQGQQIKTFNLMVHRAHKEGWILDEEKRQQIQRFYDIICNPIKKYLGRYLDKSKFDATKHNLLADPLEAKQSRNRAKKYAGATVLDAQTGFYDQHVTTADFSSLYPSLMIAYNLCFSTFLIGLIGPEAKIMANQQLASILDLVWIPQYDASFEERGKTNQYLLWDPATPRPSDDVIAGRDLIMVCHDNESGVICCFVINTKAFLPSILKDMLALRKKVKAEMEEAEKAGEKFREAVLDAQQSAIKVICNAAYGFTGAMHGYFGCIPIAITTCFLGRLQILFTKRCFEEVFGARVIYGDTDSVFVVWDWLENQPHKSREQILAEIKVVSWLACQYVSSRLPKPMGLAFEKLMFPYFLIGKKQYVGLFLWPSEKFLTKGIAAVRRDSCPLARNTIKDMMSLIMQPKTTLTSLMAVLKKALAIVTDERNELKNLDLFKRTVAKKNDYANPDIMQRHLFDKLEQRRGGTKIEEGTRVPYVMVLPDAAPGSSRPYRLHEKKDGYKHAAEDVEYVRKHNDRIKCDRSWIVEKQLQTPLTRYFAEIPGAVEEIDRLCTQAKTVIEQQVCGNQKLWGFDKSSTSSSSSSSDSRNGEEFTIPQLVRQAREQKTQKSAGASKAMQQSIMNVWRRSSSRRA